MAGLSLSSALTLGLSPRGGGGAPVATLEHFAADGSTFSAYAQAVGPASMYIAAQNKTFFAWESWQPSRDQRIVLCAYYDHTALSWSPHYIAGVNTLIDDDHGVPALALSPNGRLIVFYGGHDTIQQWSMTNDPYDIASGWQAMPAFSDQVSYPWPHTVGNTIYIFNRLDTPSDQRQLLVRKITFDGSDVPTLATPIVIASFGANTRWYQGSQILVGGKIHMVATKASADDTVRDNVYYLVFNTATDSWETMSGTPFAVPLSLATLDASFKIYTTPAGQLGNVPSLRFNASGEPWVTVNRGTDGLTMNLIRYASGAWQTPQDLATVGSRYGNAAMVANADGSMRIYYARTNVYYRDVSAAGVIGSETLLYTAGTYGVRQVDLVPYTAHPNARIWFYENAPDSVNEVEGLKLFAHGDAGYLKAVSIPAATHIDPSTMPFSDNFNRANQTLVTSKYWTRRIGPGGNHFTIVSNQVKIPTGVPDIGLGISTVALSPDFGSANHYVQASYIHAVGNALLIARYVNQVNFLSARISPTNNYQLFRVINNVYTQLGGDIAGATLGDVLRIEADGTNASLYANGVLKIGPVAIGSSVLEKSTRCGLMGRNNEGATNAFDNYEAGRL